MKRATYILVLMLMLGLLAGCGSTGQTGLPTYIVFAGSEMGSSFYTMAVGIGDLIGKHTPMTAKVQSLGGESVWLPLFETGEADLALVSSDGARQAYLGMGVHNEPTEGQGYDFRSLQVGSPLLIGMIVRNDSDIWKISDLRGKRVPSGFGNMPAVEASMKSLLANGGLTYDDVIPVPVASASGPAVKNAFLEGRLDCIGASTGSGLLAELDATVGVRFVTIDTTPEAVARMQEWFISYPHQVKAGSFTGVRDDIYVRAHDIILVARTTLSDDAVYEIMEAIWENYEELAPVHPLLENWLPEGFTTTRATVPYHPAAIDFYKKKGVWSDELEQHQNELLTKE